MEINLNWRVAYKKRVVLSKTTLRYTAAAAGGKDSSSPSGKAALAATNGRKNWPVDNLQLLEASGKFSV